MDRGDGIQVIAVFIVEPITDVIPVLTAVVGFQQHSVSAHRQAVFGILEPDIKQGHLGLAILVLMRPGLPAIGGGQDQCIVANSPAMPIIREIDGGKQLPGGHLRLRPAGTAVVGVENVAPVTCHDQTRTCMGYVEEQVGSRFRGFDGIAKLRIARLCMRGNTATQQCKQAARRKQTDQGREAGALRPTEHGRHRASLATPEDGLSHNNPLCSY